MANVIETSRRKYGEGLNKLFPSQTETIRRAIKWYGGEGARTPSPTPQTRPGGETGKPSVAPPTGASATPKAKPTIQTAASAKPKVKHVAPVKTQKTVASAQPTSAAAGMSGPRPTTAKMPIVQAAAKPPSVPTGPRVQTPGAGQIPRVNPISLKARV